MLKELRIYYFIYFEHILCWIGGQRICNTNESPPEETDWCSVEICWLAVTQAPVGHWIVGYHEVFINERRRKMAIFTPNIITNTNETNHMADLRSEAFFKKRLITIDSDLATSVISQMMYLNGKSDDDIYVMLDSPGGSVSAGFRIFDYMKHACRCDVVIKRKRYSITINTPYKVAVIKALMKVMEMPVSKAKDLYDHAKKKNGGGETVVLSGLSKTKADQLKKELEKKIDIENIDIRVE